MPRPRLYANAAEKQKAYRAAAKERQERAKEESLPRAPGIANMAAKRRWEALINQARSALETARDEMQDYHDERSEAWQEGMRALTILDNIEAITNALTELDSIE